MTLSSFCGLCIFAILINPTRLAAGIRRHNTFFLSAFIFILVCLIQLVEFPEYHFDDFSFSLLWVVLPAFALLYSDKLIALFPWYMLALWHMNMAHSLLQCARNSEVVGLAGNRNWNASLMIVSTIFTCFILYGITQKVLSRIVNNGKFSSNVLSSPSTKYIQIFTSCIIPILPASYVVYKCEARGAILGLMVTAFFFVILNLPAKHYKTGLRLVLYAAIIIVVLLALFRGPVANAVNSDIRLPLWKGCMKMIADHPVIGIGSGRFESSFAPYRPMDYFLRGVAAVRTNHPHNTPMYILACFGIFGFLAWLLIWLIPIVKFMFKYQQHSLIGRIIFHSYLLIFIHGLFDLVLFEWPTVIIGAFLLGLLWSEASLIAPTTVADDLNRLRRTSPTIGRFTPAWLAYSLVVCACFILFLTIATLRSDFLSSYYHRTGEFYESKGQQDLALHYFDKALDYKTVPKHVYKAAISALIQHKNPEMSLAYFALFNETPSKNFAHNQGFIAMCLRRMGLTSQALPYLEQEVRNYPLLAGAWYNLALAQRELKLPQADASMRNAYKTLDVKGLKHEALTFLLQNPEYDMVPIKMPPDLLMKFKQAADTDK